MKKIAMLNCLNSNKVCAGAACFTAFNKRIRSFERYQGMDVEVAAFMRCNGCENDPETEAGILEKVERLQQEGVETVHVGICTKNKEGVRCKTIAKIMEMLEEKGMEVVDGTH